MAGTRVAKLQAYFGRQTQDLRPILTSLNGDNSWLISFPRPLEERTRTGKAFYHIVHDPWLNGPATVVSSWLVHISLAAPASVRDGKGVEAVAQELETAARIVGDIPHAVDESGAADESENPSVDAILINFHYLDHMHESTLRTFRPNIPVFATPEAAQIIRGWSHFDTVITTNDLEPDSKPWTTLHPGAPLPEWLTFFRMRGHHELNFASAIIWSSAPEKHETLLYSPHGVRIGEPTLQALLHNATPRLEVLALLTGLKESYGFGFQNTFGVSYGLQVYRQARAKYWVVTHNSPLRYWGLVMLFVGDVFRTLEWGVSREEKRKEEEVERAVRLVEVDDGDFFVLE